MSEAKCLCAEWERAVREHVMFCNHRDLLLDNMLRACDRADLRAENTRLREALLHVTDAIMKGELPSREVVERALREVK